ncbi:hypothetical protein [Paenibacillus senegalensis]|uniref:hypothetical protein n=1 Tax=Paenibacillus senegalensis TaxID=1465766 RepID=UPI00030758D7|nr:hypothetical protein [Paenibacillus senegalensis]
MSILRKLEALDYVVKGKVLYPLVYMSFEDSGRIIDDYVDGVDNGYKTVPLPRRKAK